jgi:hypothetical protein
VVFQRDTKLFISIQLKTYFELIYSPDGAAPTSDMENIGHVTEQDGVWTPNLARVVTAVFLPQICTPLFTLLNSKPIKAQLLLLLLQPNKLLSRFQNLTGQFLTRI